MGLRVSEMTAAQRDAKNAAAREYNRQLKADRVITYNIMGNKISFPKGFQISGNITQNQKSFEEGFKKLQQWLKDPTPQKWRELFRGNNAFGLQLRNYLLGRTDVGAVKGMEQAKIIFDQLNVKKWIPKDKIITIKNLTEGGKGETLTSISAKTWGGTKYTQAETEAVIRNFQRGDKWLKANPDSTKIGADGLNIWRKYANSIRSLTKEQAKLGGFPYGTNSSRKLWANLYRASYRGNRIEIVGEFADGKLPLDSKGKIDWHLKNKAGVPAWKRVIFVDTEVPDGKGGFKKAKFNWNPKLELGGLQKQIDDALGKGKFIRSTRAYDTGVWLGAEKIDGRTIKDIFRENILRNQLLSEPLYDKNNVRTSWKEKMIPTEKEYKRYLTNKSPRFSLTEVHHPYGVGVDPYTSESALRFANRELGRAETSFNAGNITRSQYLAEINRINEEVGAIRSKVGSTFEGARATSSSQIFKEALRYVGKENISKLRSLYVAAAKTNKGGVCNIFRAEGGRIGFAAGSSCVRQMEFAFDADPVRTTEQVGRIKTITGKVKNATQGFLGALGKFGPAVGKFGAIAAAGAVAKPAFDMVRQFMNDDPSTYLTDPEQIEAMLLSTIEAQEQKKPRSEILDWGVKGAGVGATAAAVPGMGAVYAARRKPFTRMVEGVAGEKVPQTRPGMGVLRSATIGPAMKLISGMYTPAGLLAMEPLRIAQMRREGESWGEIGTDPTMWMGPAFASGMTRMATRGMKPGSMLSKALSLGISRPALKTISRRFGMPGLALSLGLSGYDLWEDYKDKEGWFAKKKRQLNLDDED